MVTAENISGIHSDKEKKLEAVGKHLSSILFPTPIQRHKDVKHISYVWVSCREIGRMEVMAQPDREHQECRLGSHSNEPLDSSTAVVGKKKNTKAAGCYNVKL